MCGSVAASDSAVDSVAESDVAAIPPQAIPPQAIPARAYPKTQWFPNGFLSRNTATSQIRRQHGRSPHRALSRRIR
jgi:hypothetical protein